MEETVQVIERFYKDGTYTVQIGNEEKEFCPYWHGKAPFVVVNFKEPLAGN